MSFHAERERWEIVADAQESEIARLIAERDAAEARVAKLEAELRACHSRFEDADPWLYEQAYPALGSPETP